MLKHLTVYKTLKPHNYTFTKKTRPMDLILGPVHGKSCIMPSSAYLLGAFGTNETRKGPKILCTTKVRKYGNNKNSLIFQWVLSLSSVM